MIKAHYAHHLLAAAALLTVAVTLMPCGAAYGEIIPPDRRADWTIGTNTGVPGGIPNRTTIFKNVVTDLHADNTGATDVTGIIQGAINACPDGQVVYLPAGTYLVGSLGGQASHYTLRGAGPGRTILKPTTSSVFVIGTSDWPRPSKGQAITSGATRGSATIGVGNASAFKMYQVFRIDAGTNPSYVHALSSGSGSRLSWMFRVVSTTSNTVTFSPPLPMDISNLSPSAFSYTFVNAFTGLEDLTIDSSGHDGSDLIGINQAWGCWIKNVECTGYSHRAVSIGASIQCEIRHCYFHDSGATGSGSGSEGVDLVTDACWNVLEDNIVWNGGGIVLNDAQFACSGNVIAYNYAFNHSAYTDIAVPDIDLGHGTQDTFNLVEGNVCSSIHGGDGYYGGASHNTIFRNWFTATAPVATKNLSCIFLKHYNVYTNIVGNVLGTPAFPTQNSMTGGVAFGGWYEAPAISGYDNGWASPVQVIYQLGFPNIGNTGFSGALEASASPDYSSEPSANSDAQRYDPNVKATLLRHGNYDYFHRDTIWDPSISDHTLPASLFRTKKPDWWPVGVDWPLIGPDKPLGVLTTPAMGRYKAATSGSVPAPTGLRVVQ